ncbi:DUF1471 domain-containing protein [Serratia sp. UGAL515B_01]|uniref:DUF1471 domain-containing protein n=1 Tax=Serratia sp. UGAL515B_01 TaxID=2986763 RepID=UPI0029538B66|nr:DUF1471 domain-containing protein [Serratia sp. UGAL515B_01]WON77656.1 DUF1471 domain-containing protein [Serratia sp. UGAL515B_01]
MKSVNKFVVAVAINLVSFGSVAQSVSVRALTIEEAKAKVAAQAKKSRVSYKIISTYFNNGAYMVA